MTAAHKTLRVGFDPRSYRVVRNIWISSRSSDTNAYGDLIPALDELLRSCADEGLRCALCGQRTRARVTVIEEIATGKRYALGGICANAMTAATPDEVEADRSKRGAQARANRRIYDQRRVEWNAAHPAEAKVLDDGEALVAAGRGTEVSKFVHSAIRARRLYGAPSERLTAVILPSIEWAAQDAEREEVKAQRAADREAAEAARVARAATAWATEPGQEEIVGTVITVKETKMPRDMYGKQQTVLKMVVELEDGRRLYGSIPIALRRTEDGYRDWHTLKGLRVAFTARVSPSDRDPGFGFYSRPVKARVIG